MDTTRHLTDLLELSHVQENFDHLHKITGFSIGLFDADGAPLIAPHDQAICARFHRRHPDTFRHCRTSEDYLFKIPHDEKLISHHCGNGLVDMGAPVFFEKARLGTIFFGQFLQEMPDDDFFRTQARRHAFDEQAYLDALHQTPVIRPEQARHVLGLLQNITGLRHDGTHLDQDEYTRQLLTTAASQAPDGIIITDTRWHILYTNAPGVAGHFGAPADLPDRDFCALPGIRAHEKDLRDSLSRGDSWTGQVECLVGQERRHVELEITPLRDSAGTVINHLAVSRDITHAVELQQQLFQTRKLEAIGTLAGGIAHDFNNILTSIIGYTELALDDVGAENTAAANLHEVLGASNRARDLVRHILAFSRQTRQQLRPLHLQNVVRETCKRLRTILPASITLEGQFAPEGRPIMADAQQIGQILMNLAANAIQAMEHDGGRLRVSVLRTRVETASAGSDLTPGHYLVLRVQDNGPGIDPLIRERIFDPFFSTREQGAGMGLSVVHGLVTQMGGSIRVTESSGGGATFDLYLPEVPAAGQDLSTAAPVTTPAGPEHILLVDDEPMVADMLCQTLKRLGYRVSVFTCPIRALEDFQSSPEDFDLVISDMTMPGLDGEDLAREILARRPELPVILCTGYSSRITPGSAESPGVRAILMKPVGKRQLAEVIRSVLEGSPL